jgi:RND family efflux transporter MFP subunit
LNFISSTINNFKNTIMKKYSNAGFVLALIILTAPFIFYACHSHAAGEDDHGHTHGSGNTHDPADTTQHAEIATTVSLTAAQMAAIGLQLGSVEQKNLNSTLKANGYLRVPNQNKARATTLYGGVVKSLFVHPGSVVKAGQALASIANPQIIPMQEEYLTLASRIALAELEYKRQQELNSGKAGALKNLQQADAERNTLRIRQASLKQQLQLMGIAPDKLTPDKLVTALLVRSPLSGKVSEVSVQIGSYLDVHTAVAEIVDNSRLHLDLFVYEQDLPRLHNKQIIHFTLTNNPGKEYDAEIYSIGNAFEEDTKTIPVHAHVQGDKTGLIEGMSITAVVSLGNATVPAVPAESIVTHEGQDFIFIRTAAQAGETEVTFEKIPVRRGIADVGYAEITPLNALPPKAEVVVKGAFFLLAKLTNQGEAHTH